MKVSVKFWERKDSLSSLSQKLRTLQAPSTPVVITIDGKPDHVKEILAVIEEHYSKKGWEET